MNERIVDPEGLISPIFFLSHLIRGEHIRFLIDTEMFSFDNLFKAIAEYLRLYILEGLILKGSLSQFYKILTGVCHMDQEFF